MTSIATLLAAGLGFLAEALPDLQQPPVAQFQSFNGTPAGMQPFVEPEVPGNASINTTDVEVPTTHSTVGSTVFNDTNTSAPSAAADSFDYTALEYVLGIVGVVAGGFGLVELGNALTHNCGPGSENEQAGEETAECSGVRCAP